MLKLDDRWVWDWWLADTGSEYHLFFLQAPRSLGEQTRRHRNATIGHAVSTDLREWRLLPDALAPGPAGSWDDGATWTGSTIAHDGTWYTYYTGVSSADPDVQRIGLATSPDLSTWTKHAANPILELDPRCYEVLDRDAWRDQAWRDPWVFPDPDGDGFHALITARAAEGEPDGRGVIGHARSADLLHWEVRPPLSEPGEFGHLEVPQVEIVDGTPVLL
ncbi:MAG: glycosyl hydrolase family 32, partial [Chloroflexota bacterium]